MEKPSAYQGDEPYIFVCYAHEDADTVYPEIEWLQAEGVNVWYDEGISLGSEWTEALADAIEGCTKFIFFVTPGSVTREHCRRELNFAQEDGLDVMAVHLQPTEVTGGMRLSLNNRQAIFKHELTDEQYRRQLLHTILGATAGSTAKAVATPAARTPQIAIIAVAVLVIAFIGIWLFNADREDSVGPETPVTAESVEGDTTGVLHNSIAVLPFDNLSPDPNNAYFAAGIHDEILNQLAKIKDLSVIARTTMLRYADSDKSVPEIGAELNVGIVMEGSVRYAGDRVRITTQLIDAVSGAQLWSEAHEENLEDIFGIQLAIATHIADTLEAEFSPAEQRRLSNPITTNPDAYARYLQARSRWGSYAPPEPIHEALDAAISLDPDFAAALAFKAWLLSVEGIYPLELGKPRSRADSQQAFSDAARLAQRALELDDTQGMAHYAMHYVHSGRRNWGAAIESIEQAYAHSPNDYLIVGWAGFMRVLSGDESGFALSHRAMDLAPDDVAVIGNLASLHAHRRQWQDALHYQRLFLAAAPEHRVGNVIYGLMSTVSGDMEAARQVATKLEKANYGLIGLMNSLELYARAGDVEMAERLLAVVEAHPEFHSQSTRDKFWMYGALQGYGDLAIGFLEQMVDESFPPGVLMGLHFEPDNPRYDLVRSHPKFDELVRRLSMPAESPGE